MSKRDDFKIRAPFKATYALHGDKNQPCAHYRVYNSKGQRRAKTKYFSKQYEFGSPESKAELEAWFRKTDIFTSDFIGRHDLEYTVGELKYAWHEFKLQYVSSARHDHSFFRIVVDILTEYDDIAANDFRVSYLMKIRDGLQKQAETSGHRNRNWINKHIREVVKIFEWGSTRDFVYPEVPKNLNLLTNLTRKESPALRDSEQREAVPAAVLEEAIAVANPCLRTMLILQRETGARPSELRHMSWDQIDQSKDLWVYRPVHHKNSHRGDSRNIYLTKAAQEALWEYHENQRPDPLNKELIFTKRELRAFNELAYHWVRYTPEICESLERLTLKPNLRATYGDHIDNRHVFTYQQAADIHGVHWKTVKAWSDKKVHRMTVERMFEKLKGTDDPTIDGQLYCRNVKKLCNKHGIDVFTPYQIRHLVAETIDAQYGREAVAAILGHKKLDTSAIYAKQNHDLAERVQKKRSV